ncbi:MAG TPA: hypothetical protein VNV43_09240 [Candidatus Acidoferrales bacterium]|jgi:hypothetical protein|nr:hypothetical protein [Candidatus Acidoferrales bacterium]
MKIKTNDNPERATIVKISPGQYELIGGTPEELIAAKQWAAFWGHQIVARPGSGCRRLRIPPVTRRSWWPRSKPVLNSEHVQPLCPDQKTGTRHHT